MVLTDAIYVAQTTNYGIIKKFILLRRANEINFIYLNFNWKSFLFNSSLVKIWKEKEKLKTQRDRNTEERKLGGRKERQ